MEEGNPRRFLVWRHLAVALISFILYSLAFHPVDAFPLAWCAFVPWMVFHRQERRPGTKRALLLGYYLHFVCVLWWVSEIAVLGSFLIPLLGLPFVLLLAYAVDLGIHRHRLPPVLIYPLAFVATELLRDQFLGLTWSSVGYTQWRWLELLQISSILRVHGVSFAVLAVNVALAECVLWLRKRGGVSRASALRSTGFAALLLLALHVFGAVRMNALETTEGPLVLGIQPNVPQILKHHGGPLASFVKNHQVLAEASRAGIDPDIVVFPETFGPITREPERTLNDALERSLVRDADVHWGSLMPQQRGKITVFGYSRKRVLEPGEDLPDEDGQGDQEWNVATVVRNGREVLGTYIKRELVPFGEYIPYPRGWPGRDALKERIKSTGGFIPDLTRGTEPAAVPVDWGAGEASLGLTICFEIVYPQYFRESVAAGATLLVNVSNDGWYGDSSELDLVHVQSRFRAIECGRSLVRVSNTGISTLIDPVGRYLDTVVIGGKRKEVAGFVAARVPLAKKPSLWAVFGDALPSGFLVALVALLLFGELRRRRT